MKIEDIWFGKGWRHLIVRTALLPFSGLYWTGWRAYLLIYQLGIKKAQQPHAPILVVGNFVVGGTGKTPTVSILVCLLRELGYDVVVSCSGFGSPHQHRASIAPEGLLDAGTWGDEPATLRELLPDVPLIVGRDRVLAAELCHTSFSNSVLVLDDGLQHVRLRSSVQIALEPDSLSNQFVLPAGPYREPRNESRSTIILPGEFRVVRTLHTVRSPLSEIDLSPQPIAVLTAIAKPERFIACVRELGFEVIKSRTLNDHDPLTEGTLFDSIEPELPIVVTLKDWVKLRSRPDIGTKNIYVAYESVTIEPADRFKTWLGEAMVQASKEAAVK